MKKLLLYLTIFYCHLASAQSDEVTGAIPILESNSYTCQNAETGTFEGFTKSDEFTCPGSEYATWVDAWYSFTAPETREYSVKIEALNGSIYDVRLGFFTGSPGNLTNTTGCATRYYSAELSAGETYYIHIRGAYETTEYNLCVYPFPEPPSNDEPATANELLESTFEICENSILSYTTGATHSSESNCSTSNIDVWYTFVPSETAEYTFTLSLANGSSTHNVAVYSGTPGYLNPVSNCEDVVLADLTANETYYIAVTTGGSSQAIYFDLCGYPSPPPPTNDDCTNAIELTVGSTFEDNYYIATNTSATINTENSNFPSCGTLEFDESGRDVWFTVTVPESGNVTIETRAEPSETNLNDTAMETYTGSCGIETLIPYHYNLPAPNIGTAYCSNQFVIGGDFYAGIAFTDKTPGDIIFVRVWAWAYQFGKFRISAYDPSTLGIENPTLNEKISIFPNPVENILNIKTQSEISNITVFNILGKKVINKHLSSNQTGTSIDMSQLAKGLYIVSVKSKYGSSTIKVIKE